MKAQVRTSQISAITMEATKRCCACNSSMIMLPLNIYFRAQKKDPIQRENCNPSAETAGLVESKPATGSFLVKRPSLDWVIVKGLCKESPAMKPGKVVESGQTLDPRLASGEGAVGPEDFDMIERDEVVDYIGAEMGEYAVIEWEELVAGEIPDEASHLEN